MGAVRQLVELKDPISPSLLEHRTDAAACEETGEIAYYYNHLYYEFEVSAGCISAVSYLEHIRRAIVTVPDGLDKDHADVSKVLAYLKLRFADIEARDESGNELLSWRLGEGTNARSVTTMSEQET